MKEHKFAVYLPYSFFFLNKLFHECLVKLNQRQCTGRTKNESMSTHRRCISGSWNFRAGKYQFNQLNLLSKRLKLSHQCCKNIVKIAT